MGCFSLVFSMGKKECGMSESSVLNGEKECGMFESSILNGEKECCRMFESSVFNGVKGNVGCG